MAPAAAHTADGIRPPIDINSLPPFYKRKNGILLYFLLTSSLLSSMALGIDGVSFPCLFLSASELTYRAVDDQWHAGLDVS